MRLSIAKLSATSVAGVLATPRTTLAQPAILRPKTAATLRAALAPLLRGDLRRTQYALSRADAGLYGICDACGRAIAARRLQLNPATTRCTACEAHPRA